MYQLNAIDPNVVEASKGTTAGGLLEEALWSSARVRQGNGERFAMTTRRDGSLLLSREMAMAIAREAEGLRFALEEALDVLDKFDEYGMGWHYERPLAIARAYAGLVLTQAAGYDDRYNDRRYFPRDLQAPRKRKRVAKKSARRALAIAAPKKD